MSKVAVHLFLSQLEQLGITHVFGNPGSFEQGFMDALSDHPNINYVLCLQEPVAVGAAMAYVRATKRLACVQVHGSVGLAGAATMLLEAKLARVPLLVYVGENTQEHEPYKGFLAYDCASMAREYAKEVIRATDAQQLAAIVHKLATEAMKPPYGPCVLTLPMNLLEVKTDAKAQPASLPTQFAQADNAVIEKAAALINAAKKPVIAVGDISGWSSAQKDIAAFAEHIGAPMCGVGWTMGNADTNHPFFFDVFAHSFGEPYAHYLQQFDLVISFGGHFGWEVVPKEGSYLAEGAKLIGFGASDSDIEHYQIPDLTVLGDIAKNCGALNEKLHKNESRAAEIASQLKQKREERRQSFGKESTAANHPWKMLSAMFKHISPDDVVIEESLTCQKYLRECLACPPENYHPALSRPIGLGLPSAIGAAMGTGKRIVAFSADGSALFNIQALWTAANRNLDIVFVIINNLGYNSLKANLDYYRKRTGKPDAPFPHMNLNNPEVDFVALAKSFSVMAAIAHTPEEIDDAMKILAPLKGPRLLELRVTSPF